MIGLEEMIQGILQRMGNAGTARADAIDRNFVEGQARGDAAAMDPTLQPVRSLIEAAVKRNARQPDVTREMYLRGEAPEKFGYSGEFRRKFGLGYGEPREASSEVDRRLNLINMLEKEQGAKTSKFERPEDEPLPETVNTTTSSETETRRPSAPADIQKLMNEASGVGSEISPEQIEEIIATQGPEEGGGFVDRLLSEGLTSAIHRPRWERLLEAENERIMQEAKIRGIDTSNISPLTYEGVRDVDKTLPGGFLAALEYMNPFSETSPRPTKPARQQSGGQVASIRERQQVETEKQEANEKYLKSFSENSRAQLNEYRQGPHSAVAEQFGTDVASAIEETIGSGGGVVPYDEMIQEYQTLYQRYRESMGESKAKRAAIDQVKKMVAGRYKTEKESGMVSRGLMKYDPYLQD